MSKNEYLRSLSRELRKLPKEEYNQAMDYYSEYFEDAGPDMEEVVIRELGTPREVAVQIIMDAAIKRMEAPSGSPKRRLGGVWIVILGICAAPIALPMAFGLLLLLAGLMISVVSLIGAAIITVLAVLVGGAVTAFAGIYTLFLHPATGVALLGAGMAGIGVGIFAGFGTYIVGRGMFRGIRKLFARILKRRKKR